MFILRKQQYDTGKDEEKSLTIAKTCILGKVYNSRWVLERAVRDHAIQIDAEKVKAASMQLKASLERIQNCTSKDQLRGYEGEAASIYFGVFNELILQQKKDFQFQGRTKRPPMDTVNAMLSLLYTFDESDHVCSGMCWLRSLCRISAYRTSGKKFTGIGYG